MPHSLAQRGFAMISAIFLLVVLAALGAAMMVFSSSQHITSAQDIQGVQAYQAARAGIEWEAYQVLRNGACPNASFSVAQFNVDVSCATTTYGSLTSFQFTSTASTGTIGQISRIERQLQAKIVR